MRRTAPAPAAVPNGGVLIPASYWPEGEPMVYRRCAACGKRKPATSFPTRSVYWWIRAARCLDCQREVYRRARQAPRRVVERKATPETWDRFLRRRLREIEKERGLALFRVRPGRCHLHNRDLISDFEHVSAAHHDVPTYYCPACLMGPANTAIRTIREEWAEATGLALCNVSRHGGAVRTDASLLRPARVLIPDDVFDVA